MQDFRILLDPQLLESVFDQPAGIGLANSSFALVVWVLSLVDVFLICEWLRRLHVDSCHPQDDDSLKNNDTDTENVDCFVGMLMSEKEFATRTANYGRRSRDFVLAESCWWEPCGHVANATDQMNALSAQSRHFSRSARGYGRLSWQQSEIVFVSDVGSEIVCDGWIQRAHSGKTKNKKPKKWIVQA